jgi:photosynthetic reaction center cytochrome c subunit
MSAKVRLGLGAGLVAAAALLAGCERPPMETKQIGFRGVAMEQVTNPRIAAKVAERNGVPEAQPPAPQDGPRAKEIYKNVPLLGDLSVAEFTRLMVAMTQWVAPPEVGCNYCHNPQNLADDSVYTKVVTRKMLQMTWNVNEKWKNHVADTGVTCWTCHRGNAVPRYVWSTQPQETRPQGMLGQRNGQNMPAASVALSDLPFDPFTPYLLKSEQIRVIGPTALPTGADATIQTTEATYGLMMHLSDALGVNCTFCHNSRSFASWEGPAQRVTAYHGIRMARDINNNYIESLAAVFPDNRKGPLGDVLKTNCATCHQGLNKPLAGVSMLKDYPVLARSMGTTAAAGGVAPVPTPAPIAAGATGVIGHILFELDRTELNAEARATIVTTADAMKKDPAMRVDISGFADKSGSVDHNLDLAKRRAFAVRDALAAAGAPANRVTLRKPEMVIGQDAQSRRVDLVAKR